MYSWASMGRRERRHDNGAQEERLQSTARDTSVNVPATAPSHESRSTACVCATAESRPPGLQRDIDAAAVCENSMQTMQTLDT